MFSSRKYLSPSESMVEDEQKPHKEYVESNKLQSVDLLHTQGTSVPTPEL